MVRTNECELCGRETSRLYRREVEKVIMYLCDECKLMGSIPKAEIRRQKKENIVSQNTSKFQNLYEEPSSRPRRGGTHDRPAYSAKSRFDKLQIVNNAAQKLIRLRTEEGLSYREFALSLLIKETYYKRIEKGTTALPIDLARKIEKKYKIKLVEKEDMDELADYSKFMKKNKTDSQSMVYFRKRGEQPKYDQ